MRLPIDEKKKADEEMLFMTSHQVRKLIVDLLGLANRLEVPVNSNYEMIKFLG